MAQKRENESIKSRKEPKIEEFCAEIEKTLLKNFADFFSNYFRFPYPYAGKVVTLRYDLP